MENSAKKVESVETTANANESLNANLPLDNTSKANANSTNKKTNKPLVSALKLIQAGAHIGLHPRKWNPKMKYFIYKKVKNNHIIDVVKSLNYLQRACQFLEELSKNGGKVLIVGTNGEIIQDLIKKESKRIKAFYVTQRWLGGTLTNFKNISKSIKKLNDNIDLIKTGEISKYTKKEQIQIKKDTEKLNKFYSGIKNMRKIPDAMIILDPVIDQNAVLEARKLNIPIIALANTNADPQLIDFIIPTNNNSFRTIWVILNVLIDSIALINNEPTKVIGKSDEEIILPEVIRKKRTFNNYNRHENNQDKSTQPIKSQTNN